MKCAKCGNEVDPASPECPFCASGARPRREDEPLPPRVRCPFCGSTELDVVHKNYDPGCGCLGLLLFSWWGLLLGFLGADTRVVCRNCGARWKAGRPGAASRGCGCLGTLLLALLTYLLLVSGCGLMG